MIKGISKILLNISFIVVLSLLSCSRNTVFTDSLTMKNETWKLNEIAVFKVNVDDTLNANNLNFIIRNGSSYPFRNLFLFVTAVSPEGKTLTDTLQFNLADEKGKWYGSGFGDVHELIMPYKSNVFFPRKGIYEFKIQHGMRVEDLKGVYDFGLKVEKIKK
jgi:gliding motility-associated lipoprotein GldH